eukprot:scaffold2866_cov127-Amphora_coffeaeformis.AAC.1
MDTLSPLSGMKSQCKATKGWMASIVPVVEVRQVIVPQKGHLCQNHDKKEALDDDRERQKKSLHDQASGQIESLFVKRLKFRVESTNGHQKP